MYMEIYNMYRHVYRYVYRHVYRCVYRHVCGYVYRHVCRHALSSVGRSDSEFGFASLQLDGGIDAVPTHPNP